MSALRAIFAVLIAVSVAIAPAAAAIPVPISNVEMGMADHGDVPCCPCCNSQDKSKMSVPCIIKCIGSYGAVLPQVIPLAHATGAIRFSLVVNDLRGHVKSPPTHPPPV